MKFDIFEWLSSGEILGIVSSPSSLKQNVNVCQRWHTLCKEVVRITFFFRITMWHGIARDTGSCERPSSLLFWYRICNGFFFLQLTANLNWAFYHILRRYVAEIMPIQRKTFIMYSIDNECTGSYTYTCITCVCVCILK